MPTELLNALAEYVATLSRSAGETHRAEDRSAYTAHLAVAAEIFACLQTNRVAEAKYIVKSQNRAYGIGYLSGSEGNASTSAFAKFSAKIDAYREA